MRRAARYAAAAVLGFAVGAVLFRAGPTPAPGPPLGTPAPALELADLAGERVSLAALRGRVVIVNFWATWCPPCVEELPSLDRLHRALAPAGLTVLAVSVDTSGVELGRFVREAGLALPVLRDPGGSLAAAWGVGAYPTTFVVDASGVVRESYLGPARWDDPQALAHYRQLIRGAPGPDHSRALPARE